MTWSPPLTFEERLKEWFVPPSLYIRSLYRREMKRGERELHVLPQLVQKDKLALDIGANKGVYSYALLMLSAGVHAFEPNPKTRRVLQSWAANRVTIHDIALSDNSGEATLFIPIGGKGRYSNQRASLSRENADKFGEVHVKTARLDDLNLSNVGFMKIDVEGFEQEVVEGARETLKRERPTMLIEIEERRTKRPIEEDVARIEAHGYTCKVLLDGKLVPFSQMDADKHHRKPATRADYVFNFIFQPA